MTTLADLIQTRFGGKLSGGCHRENGEACILEARSALLGIRWTDSPAAVGRPDIRGMNDAYRDDARRTQAMLRLDAALDWWPNDESRRRRFASLLAIATVREVIAQLPGLSEEIREKCRAAASLSEAKAAAAAARWSAARWSAAAAAAAAARWSAAAAAAADAAAADAADARLDTIVSIWIRCAQEAA